MREEEEEKTFELETIFSGKSIGRNVIKLFGRFTDEKIWMEREQDR